MEPTPAMHTYSLFYMSLVLASGSFSVFLIYVLAL